LKEIHKINTSNTNLTFITFHCIQNAHYSNHMYAPSSEGTVFWTHRQSQIGCN